MDLESDNGRSYCRISIADNGPGMPDSMKEKYSQGAGITSAREKGRGLGLYMVKVLLEDYGGRLRVEDRVPGNNSCGTRFVTLLPVSEMHE
jgi:signal transduction histidine kinase